VQATDLAGRVIAADEYLLAIHLMPAADPHRASSVRRLAALVNDYAATPMPAAQRLYLMEDLSANRSRPQVGTPVAAPI